MQVWWASRVVIDRVIAELAGRQHGIVGRHQLLAAGVGRRAIGTRLERGSLHLVHRGVYAAGHAALRTEGRWMAAVLACGPEAALSHRSAAGLWRLLPRAPVPPEVTRPTKFRGRPGLLVHCCRLPSDEVTRVDGIPVTSVSRTLLDLAAVVPRRQLERALNEAEVRRLTGRLSLPDLLERYPGRRGTAVLRALLRDADAGLGITRSKLEERFLALIDAHGLPRPRLNATLSVRGRFFEVDCLWAERGLVVELDGRAVHGTPQAFEADRERDRLLLSEGWRGVRVTWRQMRDDAPAVVADLRRLLQAPSAPYP